jgi:FkbM family methyltransferase
LKLSRLKNEPWGIDLYNDLNRLIILEEFKMVIDVGANIGQSCKVYSEQFPNATIYSIEPVSSTFQKLVKNTSNLERIMCFNFALGNEPGTVKIPLQEKSTLNSLSKSRTNISKVDTLYEVIQVEKLDNIAIRHSISDIDFLKVDTEGFEMEVLKGAINLLENGKIKLILLELGIKNNKRTTPYNKVQEFLAPLGYDVLGFYKQSQSLYTKSRFLMHSDVLFVNIEWSKSLKPSYVKSFEYDE